MDFSCY